LGDHPRHRERNVEGYRIVYRVIEDERRVEVLRIFGPYQGRFGL
jgi:mRNA-degrading endonuclease RelE of RelBE toxin-antitoxin system